MWKLREWDMGSNPGEPWKSGVLLGSWPWRNSSDKDRKAEHCEERLSGGKKWVWAFKK